MFEKVYSTSHLQSLPAAVKRKLSINHRGCPCDRADKGGQRVRMRETGQIWGWWEEGHTRKGERERETETERENNLFHQREERRNSAFKVNSSWFHSSNESGQITKSLETYGKHNPLPTYMSQWQCKSGETGILICPEEHTRETGVLICPEEHMGGGGGAGILIYPEEHTGKTGVLICPEACTGELGSWFVLKNTLGALGSQFVLKNTLGELGSLFVLQNTLGELGSLFVLQNTLEELGSLFVLQNTLGELGSWLVLKNTWDLDFSLGHWRNSTSLWATGEFSAFDNFIVEKEYGLLVLLVLCQRLL